MNEEAAVESQHHHHHSHSPQQSQMIDSIEKDRLDDVVVEEDENVPEIELKKKRESIGNQSDDSIENQPCIDDENDEDEVEVEAESRMKQEIIEERINTRGVKFVADSAIVGGTNPSLISSTNSNISSTSSMSKSSSLNNNNNNNTNSNPSQTSPSLSQQPQQPSQQQQQSSANSQSSSPSLSVSPRLKSQTNSKSEKISPGLAKRVQAPDEEDNSQNEEQHNQNQEEENVEVVEEKQTKTTTLAGSSNRRTMAPSSTASKSASSKSAANPAAAAAKIQNALEKNMQRLNLYRPNSQSTGGHKQQHAANLSKEDIELFTNPDYDSTSTTLASSSSINGSNCNQDEDAEYSTTTSRSIRPTGTVGGPYYLGKIPEHKTVEQSSSKTKSQYQQQQQCQQVINRSSTDREMTPDSIDNDTPQHRVSTRPNTGSRLVSKRGVNTSTSTSRNIPNSKKAPINQRTQPQFQSQPQPQPQPQKPAQQKIGVGKVNGNRKIVIPDEEEEERYEKGEDSRCGKAVAVAKKVPPAAAAVAAAAASVQQLDEEDELNNGVYIEEQDEDELDEDEYERYHRHHHHHHHDHEHYEDEEDDDEEYLDEDAEQHDDYDDDYEDEQDHSHNAHAMYNKQRHGYHHQYPHDHHAHHRQHQENNNTNKNNRSQYTKTNNYNNPIPKPIEPPKTSGAVSSSSRTAANNTNNRQDQLSKTRRVSTESESSTSKAANKAAAKPGKSETMSRSATSGDCSARRPGGPVRRKSTTASDDREFIDTDEETNKLLDTARTVSEYHDEETDEDKARRNGQDKSAVAAKSSNPSTSSQDNDRNVDRQQKSKETQPPPSTTHQIMDPDNQVLIEGVLFRARYLGSTQLVTDGNPTKLTRMLQAQEAVGRIKAPEGESQPSVEVDLFVSTEKIMVLNTDLQLDNLEIMMDHSLRSISYIADIGNLVVLMAKRRPPGGGQESGQAAAAAAATSAPSKILCHVFESPEAQLVAQSIGQAFQVAYMEYLRANGIDDLTIMKDLDYQEVLNQQEIMGNELAMFAKKECQKEVLVPKQKNEPLGLVIVESGWGSMLPTVVVANMAPTGPAARCGALNIGDQIISCNGISMVGLPLSTCQTHVKNTRHLTLVRLVVVPCPPVVEVLIKRPDTKYQLGFSVQDGIICSLLRGGIAERGGVRVGHRIIEINGHSVVATTHDKIVNMLANSVGELRMKTMPTQMFRLLTGQELPVYI